MIAFLILGVVVIVAWWGDASMMICGTFVCLLALWALSQRGQLRATEQRLREERYDRERDRDRRAA